MKSEEFYEKRLSTIVDKLSTKSKTFVNGKRYAFGTLKQWLSFSGLTKHQFYKAKKSLVEKGEVEFLAAHIRGTKQLIARVYSENRKTIGRYSEHTSQLSFIGLKIEDKGEHMKVDEVLGKPLHDSSRLGLLKDQLPKNAGVFWKRLMAEYYPGVFVKITAKESGQLKVVINSMREEGIPAGDVLEKVVRDWDGFREAIQEHHGWKKASPAIPSVGVILTEITVAVQFAQLASNELSGPNPPHPHQPAQ